MEPVTTNDGNASGRAGEVQHAEAMGGHSFDAGDVIDLSSEQPRPSTADRRIDDQDGEARGTFEAKRRSKHDSNSVNLLGVDQEKETPSNTTPQDHTSPSDDVSLNLEPIRTEAEEPNIRTGVRSQDETVVEERRVAFLPPPRVSPIFVPPHSSYPVGPPPIGSAYGSPPMGQIGVHYPREIIRVERDYSGGELVQFYPIYPLELEGRITPTQWLDTVNGINEILISAHSLRRAALHHVLAVLTLYITSMIMDTHYDKEMRRLRTFIDQCNEQLYHSQGLNILWPQSNGFLFLEIEYY